MIVGVVGMNGSGKDTVAHYIVENYKFVHKDLGQEIRNSLKNLGRDYLDRKEMINLANEMRKKFGFNYWCKSAIDSARSGNMVITSIRNPAEADEITSRGGIIIEVFADQKIRFDRTVERVKKNPETHGDVNSFEEFKAREEIELKSDDPSKQQLIRCIEMASKKLDNNGPFEHLYQQIDELIPDLKAENA